MIRFKRHPTGKIIAVISSLLLALMVISSSVAKFNRRHHNVAQPSRQVTGQSATESTTPVKESVLMTEFIDNTTKYKDSAIQFEMSFMPEDGRTLRQCRGGVAHFRLTDDNASAEIAIQIPADLDVPNASIADDLIVQFDCNEGRLDSGNVATDIRRP